MRRWAIASPEMSGEALLNKQCLTWGLQGGGPSRRQAFLASPRGRQARGTQEPRGRSDSPPAPSSLPTEVNETLWIQTLYTIQHLGRFHTQKLISSDYFRSPSTPESSCHHLVFLQILSTFHAPVQVAALPSGLWTESRDSALAARLGACVLPWCSMGHLARRDSSGRAQTMSPLFLFPRGKYTFNRDWHLIYFSPHGT